MSSVPHKTDPNRPNRDDDGGGFRRLTQTFGFQLNLWYATIFIISAAGLFALLYFLLSAAIERKDREIVLAQASEYAIVYETRGVRGLDLWVKGSQGDRVPKTFFVRLLDEKGPIYESVPEEWVEFSQRAIGPFLVEESYVRIPENAEKDLTIGQVRCADGRICAVKDRT